MAQSSPPSRTPPIEQLRTVLDLLETPKLARIYAYIFRHGPTAVPELVAELDVPQGTTYEYVRRLERAGLVSKARDERPREYEAEPLSLTLSADDETRTITPELVDAVARREHDEDIDVYIDRHGIDGLATALEYARQRIEGSVTHRVMARELDVPAVEAEIILQALEPVVRESAARESSADE
ncbi:DUF7437 domain-containing protein [Halorussus caseinilyticus]|uniref:Helix-turn-helix domain-containing protein n=1 Tax=Halorussus caseinilyticus TaxID=3034025 RepID=A0ABD5WP30_9EURY|nr:helix-turn-helix domain-containing protein [Halorussus sp. DT72]